MRCPTFPPSPKPFPAMPAMPGTACSRRRGRRRRSSTSSPPTSPRCSPCRKCASASATSAWSPSARRRRSSLPSSRPTTPSGARSSATPTSNWTETKNWRYTKGLHDLNNGHFAYLVPDGSWGWSNAGLIEDSGQTLLVDTLFDLNLTREMLDAMRRAVPAAANIGALVNTHANGDHTFGNELLEGRRIIASKACAEDMHHRPPAQYATWQKEWPNMGVAGKFWQEVIGSRFDFQGIRLVLPTETFSGELQLRVGDTEVR